jgi:hypothetical protein
LPILHRIRKGRARGQEKFRAAANVKYLAAPFCVDHYKSHIRVANSERTPWHLLQVAGGATKFFSVSVPCMHTLSAHCAREGPFCFTVDAAIADDLIVAVLCGDDEDERGRRSGIPSISEKGCEGEDHLREASQKRGSATNLVLKAFVLLVRAVFFIRLQELWGGLATVFPGALL